MCCNKIESNIHISCFFIHWNILLLSAFYKNEFPLWSASTEWIINLKLKKIASLVISPIAKFKCINCDFLISFSGKCQSFTNNINFYLPMMNLKNSKSSILKIKSYLWSSTYSIKVLKFNPRSSLIQFLPIMIFVLWSLNQFLSS